MLRRQPPKRLGTSVYVCVLTDNSNTDRQQAIAFGTTRASDVAGPGRLIERARSGEHRASHMTVTCVSADCIRPHPGRVTATLLRCHISHSRFWRSKRHGRQRYRTPVRAIVRGTGRPPPVSVGRPFTPGAYCPAEVAASRRTTGGGGRHYTAPHDIHCTSTLSLHGHDGVIRDLCGPCCGTGSDFHFFSLLDSGRV